MRQFLFLFSVFLLAAQSFAQCEDFIVDTVIYHPTCHGFSDGAIYINVSGGSDPIDIEISDSLGNILNADGTGLANILAGGEWYYIFVTDGDGCVYEDSVYLMDPLPIEVDYEIIPPSAPDLCDGDVLINDVLNTCNDEGYSCFWTPDPGADGCDLIDVCPGNYTLLINDACGCSHVTDDIFLPGSLTGLESNVQHNLALGYSGNRQAVFSSPFNEDIWVEWYSISGALLDVQKVEAGQESVSTPQNTGIYLYRIVRNDQTVIGRGKLSCY